MLLSAGFLCFWLLWVLYLLRATSSACSWNRTMDGCITGLFNRRSKEDASGRLGFYLTVDSSWLRIHKLWILVGKLEACFWFSRSHGVKWNLMRRVESYLAPSTLLLSPFSLMLDVHQACLGGDCKPKLACIWVRSEHRTSVQINSNHSWPRPEDFDIDIPISTHIWYSYVLNIKCELWK